jgi:hypothetical protein
LLARLTITISVVIVRPSLSRWPGKDSSPDKSMKFLQKLHGNRLANI